MFLYIDPGTGSMLITILIGLFGTALFFLRNLFIKIRFFGKKGKTDENMIVEERSKLFTSLSDSFFIAKLEFLALRSVRVLKKCHLSNFSF